MEAATAVAGGRRRSVLISPTWLAVCGLGALIAVVGMFLKAFNLPAGLTYDHTNNVFTAASSGKGVLAFIVITVLLLAQAIRKHRQSWLRAAYFTSFAALAWAASAAASGFSVTATDGTKIHLDPAIGPIVMTVGTAIMFASLLIARFTEKRYS